MRKLNWQILTYYSIHLRPSHLEFCPSYPWRSGAKVVGGVAGTLTRVGILESQVLSEVLRKINNDSYIL